MKKILILLPLIGLSVFFFWPSDEASGLYKSRHKVYKTVYYMTKSKEDLKEELDCKKEELASFEKVLVDVEADIERMSTNLPVCPETGRQAIFTLEKDPRPEVRVRIERLKEEIKVLEAKVSG